MTLWNAKQYARTRIITLLAVFTLLIAACGQQTGGGAQPSTAAGGEASVAGEATGGEASVAAEANVGGEASVAGEASAATGTGGDSSGLVTVSAQQQATWVRNFNPFVADFRFPTRNGVFEPLMVYNTVKAELVPWLATEYAWSDDNKTLTFKIKEGIQWSDGEPFTAKDVAYTLNLYRDNTALQGGPPIFADYASGVEAPDDTTVVVSFSTVNTVALFATVQKI